MKYLDAINAKIKQLENYARTCFVRNMDLENGQDRTTNEFIDAFMEDLTTFQLSFATGTGISLDDCIYVLLESECQKYEKLEDTYLYTLVKDWIHDNLIQCSDCGEWQTQNDWVDNDKRCVSCGYNF